MHALTKNLHGEPSVLSPGQFRGNDVATNPSKFAFSSQNFKGFGYRIDDPIVFGFPLRFMRQCPNLWITCIFYWVPFNTTHDSFRFFPPSSNLFLIVLRKSDLLVNRNMYSSVPSISVYQGWLHVFSSKIKSTVITNAFPSGTGAVLGQNGHRVPYISCGTGVFSDQ